MPADVYTHGHHASVLAIHAWRTAENSAAYLLPELRPGMRLLDVGCGPGTLTVDLARRVAPGEVVGVDREQSVLADARRHAADRGVEVDFRPGDVYALDFPEASFDVVHAHQVLQHLTDPVAALRELARVTRSGGLVAARDSDYACFAIAPHDRLLERWRALYRDVARRNRAEPDAGRFLKGWARAAGLRRVAVSSSTWTFADPETCGWWGGNWAERCRSSSFAEQAVEQGLASRDELEAIADAWRRWSIEPDACFVALHCEILARP